MLELIVIVYFLVEFVLALFIKLDVLNSFQKLSAKRNSKFLYRLSNCDFCIHFHLSLIITALSAGFIDFNNIYILIPFCVSGLKKTIYGN